PRLPRRPERATWALLQRGGWVRAGRLHLSPLLRTRAVARPVQLLPRSLETVLRSPAMRTPTLFVALSLLAACGVPEMDTHAPDFMGGGPLTKVLEAPCAGPYGVGIGSVIKDYALTGFPNAVNDTTTLKQIALDEF